MSGIHQDVWERRHRMLESRVAWFLILVVTALISLFQTAYATPRARYLGGTLSATRDTETVSLALMTPNGRETFLFSRTDSDNGSQSRSYAGFSQRRAGKPNRDRAALVISGNEFTVYFSSRRTGRPVAVSFTLHSKTTNHQALASDLQLSRVERGASIPCGNDPDHQRKPQTLNTDGLGMYANKIAAEPLVKSLEASAPLFSPPRILQVAAYADGPFVAIHGRRTAAYMESSLSAASALYMAPLGISIQIVSYRVPPASQRSSKGEDAEKVLEQFRTQRVSSFRSADLHHLFTGKAFNDSTIGIAYVASACTAGNTYAVGLSKQVKTALQPLVAAHELAHGLSAVHDNEPLSIMNPALTTANNHFSDTSKAYVNEYITGTGSCVAPDSKPETFLSVSIKDGLFSANAVLRSTIQGDCSLTLQGQGTSSRWRTIATRSVAISNPGDTTSITFTTPSPIYTERKTRRYPFRVVTRCAGWKAASSPQLVNPASAGIAAISTDTASDWLSALIASFRRA
jgi:hypothetical protein